MVKSSKASLNKETDPDRVLNLKKIQIVVFLIVICLTKDGESCWANGSKAAETSTKRTTATSRGPKTNTNSNVDEEPVISSDYTCDANSEPHKKEFICYNRGTCEINYEDYNETHQLEKISCICEQNYGGSDCSEDNRPINAKVATYLIIGLVIVLIIVAIIFLILRFKSSNRTRLNNIDRNQNEINTGAQMMGLLHEDRQNRSSTDNMVQQSKNKLDSSNL